MHPVKSVVGALIVQEGRYLLTQRPANAVLPLLWEFPGGRVEQGETDEEALSRELGELMGVRVTVGRQVLRVRHSYEDYDIDFRVYDCTLEPGEIRHLRVRDHRWVPEEELESVSFPAADKKTLDLLLKTPCW